MFIRIGNILSHLSQATNLKSSIADRSTYKMHTSMNGTYDSEVEIIAFVRLCSVRISVSSTNFINLIYYGRDFITYNENELNLFLSGPIDRGHYDIQNYNNLNDWANYQENSYKSKYHTNCDARASVAQSIKVHALAVRKTFAQGVVDSIPVTFNGKSTGCFEAGFFPEILLQCYFEFPCLTGVSLGECETVVGTEEKYGKRVENMSSYSLERKRQKDAVNNVSKVRLQKKRLAKKRCKDVVQNMTDDKLEKTRCKDVVQNMTDDKLEKKRCKDIVENMTEVRLEKNRCKNIVENMIEIRLEKKRFKDTT
ncbi:hypothetical protein TSAR_012432 [Trichomalopsis sarcophagae]|uniref:Uncharacterized protein n=1 Tax=Trichomalopsis sarcophagae TaxID=543379 RepID=A0A232F218_9HYME|nr:hypothetical protein TSAR_012432 [Trichomalopsis sarcophagae]